MLMPASAASEVISASDARPVGHGDAQLGQVVGPGDAGGQVAPGRAGRFEHFEQGGTVVAGHAVAHRRAGRRPACRAWPTMAPGVLGADVGPDARVPGRHPGHVAEAAGGQAQQRAVLLGAGARRVHQRGRHQVGHVGDHGDQPVVVGGREHEHVGPQARDHALEAVEGGQVGGRRRGEHPDRALEEVGVGPAQPDLLGAGHGVAADEAGMVGCGHDGRLDPAHVGHHGVGLRRARSARRSLGHGGHRRGRDGHEDDLGLGVVADGIHHALGERLAQALLVGVEARHVPTPPAQAQGDRARR